MNLKRILILIFAIVIMCVCASCDKDKDRKKDDEDVEDVISEDDDEEDEEGINIPITPNKKQDGTDEKDTKDKGKDEQGGKVKSALYDPSIFVIEASGTWRQELAPGYYADYEVEVYLDKVDANDNRSATGSYTGICWIGVTIDASEYFDTYLKGTPVNINFVVSAEGICDNLVMTILDGYERDPQADYSLPGGDEPSKDVLADKGSFIASGTKGYLSANVYDSQGSNFNYEDSKAGGEVDFQYVIQIEADPDNTAQERDVIIHLTSADGINMTLEGKWYRLPGYPDDIMEYINSAKHQEFLDKHGQQ